MIAGDCDVVRTFEGCLTGNRHDAVVGLGDPFKDAAAGRHEAHDVRVRERLVAKADHSGAMDVNIVEKAARRDPSEQARDLTPAERAGHRNDLADFGPLAGGESDDASKRMRNNMRGFVLAFQ